MPTAMGWGPCLRLWVGEAYGGHFSDPGVRQYSHLAYAPRPLPLGVTEVTREYVSTPIWPMPSWGHFSDPGVRQYSHMAYAP
jgi:hypothetical protein